MLTALLGALDAAYAAAPNDAHKRKSWIYEVPLGAVHQLRESLNAVPPGQPFPPALLATFDLPVLAACVKLWMLELNPPLGLWEGWEDFRKLYPTVGGTGRGSHGDGRRGGGWWRRGAARLNRVAGALLKLPRVHLLVLDAIVKHLKTLADGTKTEESDEVFFTKLALSMGRVRFLSD